MEVKNFFESLRRKAIIDLHREQFLDKILLKGNPSSLESVFLRLEVDILIVV